MIWRQACLPPGDSMDGAQYLFGAPICCSNPVMKPTQADSIARIAHRRANVELGTRSGKGTQTRETHFRRIHRFARYRAEWLRSEVRSPGCSAASRDRAKR